MGTLLINMRSTSWYKKYVMQFRLLTTSALLVQGRSSKVIRSGPVAQGFHHRCTKLSLTDYRRCNDFPLDIDISFNHVTHVNEHTDSRKAFSSPSTALALRHTFPSPLNFLLVYP